MVAMSSYSLDREQQWQLNRAGATLTIGNRSANVVTVRLDKVDGSETVVLAETGTVLTCDTAELTKVTLSASAYPSLILLAISPGFLYALSATAAPAVWRSDPASISLPQGEAFTPSNAPKGREEAQAPE